MEFKNDKNKSEEKLLKFLSVTYAGVLTISSIIHSFEDQPHIHPKEPKYYQTTEGPKWVVVSGTSITDLLPDSVEDLGINPNRAGENKFRITIPSSYWID